MSHQGARNGPRTRFTAVYPLDAPGAPTVFHDGESVSAFARAAEAAGFDAIAFTDHPAPSRRWLDSGGHASYDPFAALAFCAAVTTRMTLMTYLAVLPYRNPFITAKAAATVDRLSGGRLVVAAGTGYLKSEFAALGVPFEERNERFEEAVEVMRGVWADDDYRYEGPRFRASGQAAVPGPVRPDGPPLWIGGNSRASRRRVARYGQGWTPLLMPDTGLAETTRTPPMTTAADLKRAVADLRELAHEAGRDPDGIDVQTETGTVVAVDRFDGERHVARVAELAEAGATWVAVRPDFASLTALLDALGLYGEAVIRG